MVEAIEIGGFPAPNPTYDADYPEKRYRALPYVSQTGMKAFALHSPHHYNEKRHLKQKVTDFMIYGSAIHCAVLTPELFDDQFFFYDGVRNPKFDAYIEFKLLRGNIRDDQVLRKEDEPFIRRYREGLMRDQNMRFLLDRGEQEASIFWTDIRTGLPCKGRLDARNGRWLTDLKGMQTLTAPKIQRKLETELLPLQAVHYLEGMHYIEHGQPINWSDDTPTNFVFNFLFTPNTPPSDEGIIRDLDLRTLRDAAQFRNDIMDAMAQCYRENTWPRVSSKPATASVHKRYLTYNPL